MLHFEPFESTPGFEMPVVANIDPDPAAEILVTEVGGARGLVAYEVPGSTSPRSTWNQRTYHACNVADDGTIPTEERAAWQSHRSWFAQVSLGACEPDCPERPEPLGAVLRLAHDAHAVTLSWVTARALVAGESFALLKAWGAPTATFDRVSPPGERRRVVLDVDASSTFQAFDLRAASWCDELSADEFPPTHSP